MTRPIRCFKFVLLGLLAIVFGSQASAAVLYGSLRNGENASSILVTIDPVTGVNTPIGPTGFNLVIGLDFDPNGVLYGVDNETDQLLRINPLTGVATSIGSLGNSFVSSIVFDSNGNLFGSDRATNNLLSIDVDTGATTTIGPLGVASVNGLDFDGSGTLFGVSSSTDELLTIDPATGEASGIGSLGSPFASALAYDGSTMFAGDFENGQLLQVNLTTGAATPVGPTGSLSEVTALAYGPSPVPEPSSLLALTALCGIGFVRRSRRR